MYHQLTQSKGDLLMEFILQQVADNCTDFFNFSENKIFNEEERYSAFQLMEDFSGFVNGIAIMMLEGFFSKLDDKIYEAIKREKRFHVQEKGRERTVITKWREMKIVRRYYKDKVTGKFVYLLDALLDLPSNKRIDPYYASEIISYVTSMSYAKAAEASTPAKLSRQSVKNLVHSLPTPPTTLQTEIEPKSVETVYIEVDEDYVSLQTGKNINMKLATVYTDKVDVGFNRMELVEKHAFTSLETPKDFWMQIDSYLADAYVEKMKEAYPHRMKQIVTGATYIENQ